MKKKVIQLINHPLISGSATIFIGSLCANFLYFLFNVSMSRNLSVADYGVLVSLMSLITYPAIISGSIIPTIVNFGATYFAQNELAKVRGLFIYIVKPILLCSLVLAIVIILFSKPIGEFFKIYDTSLIYLAAVTAFIGFVSTINTGLLQAKLAFRFLAAANLIAASSKLLIGVFLVLLGYKIMGAMWAVFFSFLLPFLIGFIPLRFLFKKDLVVPDIHGRKIFSYGARAAITTLGLTSLISTDMILVKHFFDPHVAGLYAVLSLIGRVIFYFTAPIGTVMFPLVVQKYEKQEDYKGIFYLSFFLVFAPSIAITSFYFLFPEFTIEFFSKKEESLVVAPYLGFFGILATIYSVLSIFTNYLLSINKTKIFIPISITALSQVILIWIFHESFMQIILISISCISLLLLVLLLYYWKSNRGKK